MYTKDCMHMCMLACVVFHQARVGLAGNVSLCLSEPVLHIRIC